MDVHFFKMIKRKLWLKTGIKILMCLLLALMYLDGEHYPQCMNIFPDEIFDLSCSFSLNQIEIEKGILCEESNHQRVIPFVVIRIFSIWSVFKIKNNSLNESLISQGFKKRLFSLQHYNC
jgi:hypothetical protein